jgi:hypothetical protein
MKRKTETRELVNTVFKQHTEDPRMAARVRKQKANLL